MRNRQSRQGGFLIMSLLIVISALSVALIQWANYQEKRNIQQNAESFYNRVLYLNQQLHAFASARFQSGTNINSSAIFPYRLSELEGTFIPACSVSDNKQGKCTRYDQTPWGKIEPSHYRVVPVGSPLPEFYYAELDFILPPATDEKFKYERSATLSLFSRLPNVIYDGNNKITLRIDRPDKAFGYDSLVKRSGDDSTLLGDWDIGGLFGLTNVRDVALRASNGSQIPISTRLSQTSAAKHEEFVEKPSCIAGQEPRITLGFSSLILNTNEYLVQGGFHSYILDETDSHWQIGINVKAKNRKTGVSEVITSAGEALVITYCR